MPTSHDVTKLLLEWSNGNRSAMDELLPLVYRELQKIAHRYLGRERQSNTLQTTALVHEAFLKLVDQRRVEWQNRAHFFGIAARLMREILIEYARGRHRQKRGGELRTQIALDDAVSFHDEKQVDVIAVDEALSALEKLDERQARIVEMKFFGGLTVEEIAEVLDVSPATIKREWKTAKLLLYKMLNYTS